MISFPGIPLVLKKLGICGAIISCITALTFLGEGYINSEVLGSWESRE
jgi:hypothetical protein